MESQSYPLSPETFLKLRSEFQQCAIRDVFVFVAISGELTHDEIALALGIHPQTVARAIRELRKAGWVELVPAGKVVNL